MSNVPPLPKALQNEESGLADSNDDGYEKHGPHDPPPQKTAETSSQPDDDTYEAYEKQTDQGGSEHTNEYENSELVIFYLKQQRRHLTSARSRFP